MTKFHEGQDVRVYVYQPGSIARAADWRKAKIDVHTFTLSGNRFMVLFPDGTRAVFDAEHIMPLPYEHLLGRSRKRARLAYEAKAGSP